MHRRQYSVQDRIEGLVVGLHKYGKEHHIVIKTKSGEERDLKLSEYLINWIDMHLFP